jgi:RimJ/RimL family protein N-acetyltransferase
MRLRVLIAIFVLITSLSHASVEFLWGDPVGRSNLMVVLRSPRLMVRSVLLEDRKAMMELFSDPEVTRTFGWGRPKKPNEVTQWMRGFENLWKAGNPYSAFSVFDDKSQSHLGFIALSASEPGHAEMYYAYQKSSWGEGYGKEAATLIVEELVPVLIRKGIYPDPAAALPLKFVDASALTDNQRSWRILDGLGFTPAKPELPILWTQTHGPEYFNKRDCAGIVRTWGIKFGAMRWHFTKTVQ